jgi:predicted oxidoreductase (fatty acid repression mutant protein)
MNILQKIETFAKNNDSQFNISGSKRTKLFYNKNDKNIYKIISSGNNDLLFKQVCAHLVQDNQKCTYFENRVCGYFAIYEDENFILHIETNFNGYNTICVYKK